MKSKPIDKRHLVMLKLILMDDRILESLHVDGALAKKISVKEDGSLAIGKYKYGWVNEFFNSLVGFIQEAIDKILKKDEKEKVIELLLHYSTLLSDSSPLKITYDNKKDDPGFNRNEGTRVRKHMVGVADAIIDFGGEQIPVQLHVDVK